MSFYARAERYGKRKGYYCFMHNKGIIGSGDANEAIDSVNDRAVSMIKEFYRQNPVIRDAIDGRRSVEETIAEYTMHGDMVLPGTGSMETRRMNRHLRRAIGYMDPLDKNWPSWIVDPATKIEGMKERARKVDAYIKSYRCSISRLAEDGPKE